MGQGADQGDLIGFGRRGEEAAARFLESRGWRVLEKNYRCRFGEIDLIARCGSKILFVEVKSRRSFNAVSPWELISSAKRRRISRTAQHFWTRRLPARERPSLWGEFGLITVDGGRHPPLCDLVEGIFPLAWGY